MCLNLNNGEPELCTPYPYGFQSHDLSDMITWRMISESVEKVSLIFRSSEPAQIAEIQLFHIEEQINIWNDNNNDVSFTNVAGGIRNENFSGSDFSSFKRLVRIRSPCWCDHGDLDSSPDEPNVAVWFSLN